MLTTVLALVVHAAALAAAPPQDQPTPVFRSGADLVRFDVRVVDERGRAITDLKADEIQIFEGNERRPVLVFQHVEEPAGAYVEAAVRAVSAEVSSNRGTPRGHLYIFVFDQHHITPGNEHRARRAAETFIRRHVRPSDRMAIFGVPGPGPDMGFTADRTRAIGELPRVRGSLEREVATPMGTMTLQEAYDIAQGNDRTVFDLISRFGASPTGDVAGAGTGGAGGRGVFSTEDPAILRRLIQENARTVVAQADADARQFLQRLAELIREYRAIEGRKIVVLFSEGFHPQNVTREVEEVAAAAAQSSCAFYAMDLNQRTGGVQQAAPGGDRGVEILQRLESLGSLAAETDGALVPDAGEHLDAALERLSVESQGYYLVGFEPGAAAMADRGSYRRISVKVTRPGARVNARTGYATPPERTPADRRRAIDAALGAPYVQQGLAVEYTTYVTQALDTGRPKVVLSLAAELPVRDGARADRADVVFVVRDVRDGRVVASGTDRLDLPEQPAPGSPAGRAGYRVGFEVPPGSYMMRAVVREPGGLVGSADRRFDVPRIGGPSVVASDMILGSAEALPVKARAHVEEGVTGVVETYARTPDHLADVSVTVDLIPAGAERAIASVVADLEPAQPTGAGAVRRARFDLPLSAVPAGEYTARARVRARGEAAGEPQRQVQIVAGGRTASTARPAPRTWSANDLLEGALVQKYLAGLKRSPAPSSAAALRGIDLFRSGDYQGAARALSEALTLEPSNALTAFTLGWAHEAAGSQREAISAWRAAAVLDPTLVPAHLAVADAYMRLSEPALAVQALRAGLTAVPGSLELRNRLVEIQGRE